MATRGSIPTILPRKPFMTTTMEPLRCVGLKTAVLSDDGTAVLFELMMANGKIFPLELTTEGVTLMVRSLLAAAQALPAAEGSVDLDSAVRLSADALRAHRRDDGSVWWTLRHGSVDLALGPVADSTSAGLATPTQGPHGSTTH